MKKIKLFLLKTEYLLNSYIGPIVVNERKYGRFLKDMLKLQNRIQELESDIQSKIGS